MTGKPPQSAGADASADGVWFLRLNADQVRGPIPLTTLRAWAESGALAPHEELSRDGRHWQPAPSLADLGMEWVADLGDGHTYGPFNILAAQHLTEHGVLKTDSVLRRVPPSVATPPPEPTAAPMEASADPINQRVGELEQELQTLRRELTTVQRARSPAEVPAHPLTAASRRGPAATAQRLREEIRQREAQLTTLTRDPATDEHWQHPPSLSASNPRAPMLHVPAHPAPEALAQLHDDGYVIWRPEDVRELARSRRFRVSTLRWNVINSSLVTGTGVTVGALGYILETEPVHYTGLVLSVLGIAYFLIVMLMLLLRKAITWVSITTHADLPPMADGHPVRGALSITVYWFNRTFRSRPPDDEPA